MKNNKNIGIIGGDKRNLCLAEMLYEDGQFVKICGFENLDLGQKLDRLCDSFESVVSNSKYLIFPTVPTTDNKKINIPFSSKDIIIDDNLVEILKEKIIFCGKSGVLYAANSNFKNLTVKDYSLREDFMILNALPTAQGAIFIALKEHDEILMGSNCLISGFGRIGKILAKLLSQIGCNVTVSARKSADLSWIKILGYKPLRLSDLKDVSGYDLIFNTVPRIIFNKNLLITCNNKAIIIDLASMPGGTDFEYANSKGIKAIHALGLPGKVTPITAAKIIKETIYGMIEEENL